MGPGADHPARPHLHLRAGLRIRARGVPLQRQYLRRHLLHGDRLPRRPCDHRLDLPDRLPGPRAQRPIQSRPSISASSSPPGTGISSTWCGCSCSPAYMCGAPACRIPSDRRADAFAKGGVIAPPFCFDGKNVEAMPDEPLPIARGLRGRCPRCGEGKLFQGFLTLRPRCEKCGLDFGFADAGDGPAVFVILLGGAIVVFAALITEVVYQPPYWVHAVLWLPLILLVTLAPLRPIKGLMIALQYHHKAQEGRLDASGRRVSEPRERRRGGVIEATVFALAGVAILIGLGIWQLERKVWKENLIATLTARLARAPAELAAAADWPRLTPDGGRIYPREVLRRIPRRAKRRWSTPPAPPSAPTCRGRAIGCSRRRGLPAAASSSSTAASCRSSARIPRAARKARRMARSTSSASCAGRRRAACSRRPTSRRTMSGTCAIPAAIAAAKKWDTAAPFYIEQEAPGAARRLAQAGQARGRAAGQPPAIRHHLVRPRARPRRRLWGVACRAPAARRVDASAFRTNRRRAGRNR